MRNRGVLRLLVAVAVGAASPAAADATFDDEKAFLSAVGSASFESFEELAAEEATRRATISTAGFTVTTRYASMGIFSSQVVGLHATHGSQHLVWDAGPGQITFTFESSITAFGVSLNDALDQGADPRLSLTTDSGATFPDLLIGPLGDANERFIGITTDAPFTAVTISMTARDSVGLDAVHFAPIAEPTSARLLATGLTALAARTHGLH